jgi:hypothetical protein
MTNRSGTNFTLMVGELVHDGYASMFPLSVAVQFNGAERGVFLRDGLIFLEKLNPCANLQLR